MTTGLRVVIASSNSAAFRLLHAAVADAGHVPVAYLVSRTMRPAGEPSPYILEAIKGILSDLPPGMDLLLPGGPRGVASALAGYAPDVLLVFGFNWRLPREVLELPRLGALNVHPSPLPKYRGPSPLHWAVRNGDPYLGITVHRMTERIDAGPVLAQVTDIPIPDDLTRESAWNLQAAALPGLLSAALDRAAHGDPGTEQDENAMTYAGLPPQDWYTVTWRGDRRDVYNQLRFLRFFRGQDPVIVTFEGRQLQVDRAAISVPPQADDGSTRVECADGPLWVTFSPVADSGPADSSPAASGTGPP